MRYKYLHILLEVLLPIIFLASCQKETVAVASRESRFFLALEEENGTPPTRSILQSADIETKVTSVTLGLYLGGVLVASEHYGSGFDQMVFALEDGTYTVYALANMGDMREALPENESAIPSLTYSIPGYLDTGTGIEYRGIPMAGSLDYTVGVSSSSAIPIKRLMAKVTAVLSCEWTGVISAVKVFNLNRCLKPFGVSAAASEADILPVQEFQTGSGTSSGTFVFYVPENMQGSISAIADPSEKSPEGHAGVDARKARLTYLEATVNGVSGVEGSIKYRSFLGENATSSFDIQRNCRYTWTLRYLPDGRLHNDWKHENNLSWSEYRYYINPTSLKLYSGESALIDLQRAEDRYVKGVLFPSGGGSISFGSHFNWSYASPANPSLVNDSGAIIGALAGEKYSVYAVGEGVRRITATGPDGSGDISLYCDVTSLGYKRQLLLMADPGPRAVVGETVRLRALVYTTQNGITTGGVDVSSSYDCHIFRAGYEGSNAVHVPSQGLVTATAEDEERFSASYNYEADGKTIYANGLFVTFEQVRTGNLTLSGGTTPGIVGGAVALHATFTQYSNGSATGTTDVTSQAIWNVQDGDGVSVSAGVVMGTQPGASVIQASYTAPNGKLYRAQAVVLFNSH